MENKRNDQGSFRIAADNDGSRSGKTSSESEEDQESESSQGSDEGSADEEEGDGEVRVDNPLKIISIKVQTSLGEDIAFVSQFHDCMIIDCVTNKKMMPIKVPG